MDVSTIALALGSSLAAGLNLYLTVLALGLLQRFEVLSLPESMQALSHPWVLIAAGVLFLICLLYTSPSPRDLSTSRMPSSA